eukprot:6200985-Pleurochrysis_carterae.AAC.2
MCVYALNWEARARTCVRTCVRLSRRHARARVRGRGEWLMAQNVPEKEEANAEDETTIKGNAAYEREDCFAEGPCGRQGADVGCYVVGTSAEAE